ncbi:MAG: hypothetical protein IT521_15980 [Burkholderiales bacterium]|nr:hypothetical protein [Burkholderiales bacterium]
MSTIRSRLLASGFAFVLAALAGCTTTANLIAPLTTTSPTSAESKQHWDAAMAGIKAKSEPEARAALNQLLTDAHSMRISKADSEYMIHRLRLVSSAIDVGDWVSAAEQLQAMRWRYGRM